MDWLPEVRLSSLVLESHEVQSQAHISLTPSSSSSPPSGPRSEVVVWELEEDSSSGAGLVGIRLHNYLLLNQLAPGLPGWTMLSTLQQSWERLQS